MEIPCCSRSRIGIVSLYSKPSIGSSLDHRTNTWFPCWKDFVNGLTAELARYTIFSIGMLAVNFNLLSVPGVVNPNSPAVSTIASIVFSFALLNVYNNPRLLITRNLAAMGTLSQTKPDMAGLAISLPIASVVWSIALFSVALAVQIFGRKEPVTVATLSVEVLLIILFVFMGMRVTRLFSQNDDGQDGDASANSTRVTGPHQNL
ncbi:hypothetical protein V8E55_002771 [Tylopilus felleus]